MKVSPKSFQLDINLVRQSCKFKVRLKVKAIKGGALY